MKKSKHTINPRRERKIIFKNLKRWFKEKKWVPFPEIKQIIFDLAVKKYICIGKGGGKTEMAGKILGGYVRASEELKRPLRILVAAPERKLTMKVWRVFWKDITGLDYLVPMRKIPKTVFKADGLQIARYCGNKSQYHEVVFKNGTIVCTGSGKNENTLMGDEWDLTLVDETGKFNKDSYDTMMGSLGRGCRLNHLINIGTPTDFMYDLFKKARMCKDGRIKSWRYPTSINPFRDKKSIADNKIMMDRATYLRDFEAQFTAMKGQVYAGFLEYDAHNRDLEYRKGMMRPIEQEANTGDFSYNPELPLFLTLDFGLTWPVCLVTQEDVNYIGPYQGARSDLSTDKPAVYVIDEFNPRARTSVEVFGSRVLKFIDQYKRSHEEATGDPFIVSGIYGDPSGVYQGYGKTTGYSDIKYFREVLKLKVGYQTNTILRGVAEGTKVVQHFVRNAEDHPHLFIDQTRCKHLIDDMIKLKFPMNHEGNVIDDIPVDDNFHAHAARDAIRYFFINRPYGQRLILGDNAAVIGQRQKVMMRGY